MTLITLDLALVVYKALTQHVRYFAFLCCFVSTNTIGDNSQVQTTLSVKYTDSIDPYFKKRDAYFLEILNLALEKSDREFNLVPVKMQQQIETRDIVNIKNGVLDVHWLHTLESIESELLPVRIPLFKGLIGWRLMLVHKDNIDILKNVRMLDDLIEFSALQSYDWPDTKILKANGFKVQSAIEYKGLFKMLDYRRAEMFPRSVVEIWGELQDQSKYSVAIDKYIALHYTTAYYFFVNKNNKDLHAAIEQGLNRAVADGSFDTIFLKYYSQSIENARLSERLIMNIKNPYLPALTPLNRKELWFYPKE